MSAFLGIANFFTVPLDQVARDFGYSEDNILILNSNKEALRRGFPDIYKNISSCKHHADKRDPFSYAQDIVASWLMEDCILKTLNRGGLVTTLNGADRNRQILPGSKTKASSDYTVSSNEGVNRKLELMNDYTGFWHKSHKLHLRDNKFKSMQKENSLLLAISTTTKEFAIFDFKNKINAKYIPSHYPYGCKPAYELDITDNMIQNASSENIINTIKQYLK